MVPVQPLASVALKVIDTPAALAVVGVPLSTPEEVKVRPAGKVPLVNVQVYAGVPPVALKVCEYGAPHLAPRRSA